MYCIPYLPQHGDAVGGKGISPTMSTTHIRYPTSGREHRHVPPISRPLVSRAVPRVCAQVLPAHPAVSDSVVVLVYLTSGMLLDE